MPRDHAQKTISTVVVRALVRAAATLGLDADPGETGIDGKLLDDPEARVSEEAATRLWLRLEKVSGDPSFGLKVAEELDRQELGLLGYLCRSAADVGRALQVLADHVRFLSDSLRMILQPDRDRMRVRLDIGSSGSRHGREALLALFTLSARRTLRRELAPREVRFRHPRPADLSVHRRIFRAPVTFMQRADELVVDRDVLELPMPDADATLHKILLSHTRTLLERSPAHDGLIERLRRTVEEGLRTHELGLSKLADSLHLSPRTLQRRLSDEGTSLHSVIDETRRDLALRLLDSDVPIAEAAYLVGFSEPSAFHRAFKRWTGQTPTERRKRNGQS
jgi:AraC-like DNA-binding protein